MWKQQQFNIKYVGNKNIKNGFVFDLFLIIDSAYLLIFSQK